MVKESCSRGPYLSLTPAQKYKLEKRAAEGYSDDALLYEKIPRFGTDGKQLAQI